MTAMVFTAVTAIVAALQADTPVCPHIYRVRRRPIAEEDTQALVVRAEQTEVSQTGMFSGAPLHWESTVSVECYQRAFDDVDLALDPLIEAVFSRLMTEPTLGGAVVQITPKGISFDYDADGQQTACANIVFTVRHRTNGATLS